MGLSSGIGSAFGVKLENQVPSSSFGPTKMGCCIISDILDWEEGKMKKIKGLGAMLLAGLLIIPGNLGLADQVLQLDAVWGTSISLPLGELRAAHTRTLPGFFDGH